MSTQAYCTHCQINWNRLRTVDDEHESYAYCPGCLSDAWLIDYQQDKPGYSMDMQGKMYDAAGNEVQPVISITKKLRVKKQRTDEEAEAWHLERIQKDEAIINRYREIVDSEGVEAAEAFYYNHPVITD